MLQMQHLHFIDDQQTYLCSGVRSSPRILIHGTDKVEEGLIMVLFFGLVFSVASTP